MARVIGKRVIIKNDIGNIDDNVKWSRTDCVGRMIYLIPTFICFRTSIFGEAVIVGKITLGPKYYLENSRM